VTTRQKDELVLNMSFILKKALCILVVSSDGRLAGQVWIGKLCSFPAAKGIILFLVRYLIIE